MQQERSIRATEKPGSAGNHFKLVTGRLLPCVMHQQQTDTMPVREFLHLANNVIIIGVAVSLAAGLADFLRSVDNNKFCVRVLPHKFFKLLIETVSDLFGIDGKVKIISSLHTEHAEHTLLQTLVIIFKLDAWRQEAAKLDTGEIPKEEYDQWRYKYPEFDTTQRWAKVPSQELSDWLVKKLNK